jgi:hypothetical protein
VKPLATRDKSKLRMVKDDESLLDTDFQIQTYIAHPDQSDAVAEEPKQ